MESEKEQLIHSRNLFLGEFIKIKVFIDKNYLHRNVESSAGFMTSIKRMLGFKSTRE